MYAPNFGGLLTCFTVGLPFYEKDLVSTALVVALAFGAPVAVRHFQHDRTLPNQQGL
jgi:hypothetical protein